MTTRRAILIGLPLVLLGWIAILALVMRLGGSAPAALVLFPPQKLIDSLPDGVAITASGPFSLTLKSDRPDLVQVLYAAGAPLVLPSGLTACLPQTAQPFGS